MSFEEEYANVQKKFKDDPCILIEPWESDINHLRVIIRGLKITPYKGGFFIFEIKRKSKSEREKDKNIDFFSIPISEYKKRKGIPIYASLMVRGKILPAIASRKSLREYGFHPTKDVITIMSTLGGNHDPRLKVPFTPDIWSDGQVYCITLIWHPNVASYLPPGNNNIVLGEKWNPNVNLTILIKGLKDLVHLEKPIFDPFLALNSEAAIQYLDEINEYENKARKWTRKYAKKEV